MRTKMIAGNVVAVLLVGVVSYFVVSSQLEATFLESVDSRIGSHVSLFDQLWRLQGRELAEQAVEQARENDTADVFTALDEAAQRQRAYERATEVLEWLGRRNRNGRGAAEIAVITDDRGVVIARSQDRNRMHGDNLGRELSSVSRVIETGEPAIDVWRLEEGQTKYLQIAIAAIRDPDGSILGALVVGYDMSNGMAQRLGDMLGRDVAFVSDGAIGGSSMEGAPREALGSALFEQQAAATTAALAEDGATSDAFSAELGDDQYAAMVAPLSYSPSADVAYVVLGNRSEARSKASPVNTILIMTVLGILAVLIYGFLLGNSFIKPIEQMEEGVLAVINGRTDLRLDIESAELGGLAYRINQLLNVFTGTPEEDEDGRVSSPPEAWAGTQSALATKPDAEPAAPQGGGGGQGEDEDPELAAKLAAEPEDAYYARIYREYVAAKEAAGENVSNITEDRFIQRLQANEKSLVKKHGCRMVRFQVQTRGTQVNLRPVIIR